MPITKSNFLPKSNEEEPLDSKQFCEEDWLFPGMFNMYVKKHKEADRKKDKIRHGCKGC